MGKWAARLAEKFAAPAHAGTDKTAKRGLLSVLAVSPERGACECRSVSMPALARAPEALDLAVVVWTDAEIAAFRDRRARLLRWGWPETAAEKLAERLVIRDRGGDPRVSCTDCAAYRPGRCENHRRAGLNGPDVGRDLAALLQRCPGFKGAKNSEATA